MLKYLPVLCVLILGLSTGCVNTGEPIHAAPGQEFSLQIGQVAKLDGEDLEIRFEKVAEDSRCPKNVTCVWAGRAVCEIGLTKSGVLESINLTVPGLTGESARSTYKGYELSCRLTPYPEAGTKIPADSYRLHLIITKQPVLSSMIAPVIAAPAPYEGKDITVAGYYRGWDLLHEANITPPVTRSDWVIKDASGAIYVNANSKAKPPAGLLPNSIESTNTVLEVRGVIRITKDGQPYIDAASIVRIP